MEHVLLLPWLETIFVTHLIDCTKGIDPNVKENILGSRIYAVQKENSSWMDLVELFVASAMSNQPLAPFIMMVARSESAQIQILGVKQLVEKHRAGYIPPGGNTNWSNSPG
jgi:hypothetical protein